MTGENWAVATEALRKHYGRDAALAGLDLRVPEGAVYVLVGENGAGKTTTFRLLLNLLCPDSGKAEVLGLDPALKGPEVRARVGYVPEHHEVDPAGMSCAWLLRVVSRNYPTWDAGYAEQLSQALALDPDRRVGVLSKGERRRLQLVIALARRPAVLLLDEPTDGLDPIGRRRVLALLTEHLADTPTTVLVATHHVHELETLADHVGVLRAGRLLAQLPRHELLQSVRSYRVELPAGWRSPPDLPYPAVGLSGSGREVEWTLIGDERTLHERLREAGARVRDVRSLSLEDAALAYLSVEDRT